MARMPGARWQGEHGVAKMAAYRRVCIHTIVGNPPAHAAHFSTAADGTIYQSRDTVWQSSANYRGNHDTIAIENDDHGPEYGSWNVDDGRAVPGFTDLQAEGIAQILLWAHQTHGVPLVLCPDSRPGSYGVSFHRQGCDGNWAGYAYGGRVSGGELWSRAAGKVCPGDRRIGQLINTIIPRARQLAGLDQPIAEAEDMMELVRGDSTQKTPNGEWPWGAFVFLVEYGVQHPNGAARRYMAGGPAFDRMQAKLGAVKTWAQLELDSVAVVPGGEIPPEMYS